MRDLAATVEAGGEVDLPAQPVGRLQEHHVVPARAETRAASSPAGLPPITTTRRRPSPRAIAWHGRLAPGGRVVDAQASPPT